MYGEGRCDNVIEIDINSTPTKQTYAETPAKT